MASFAVTRPQLYVVVIRDDSSDIKHIIQLILSILLWLWLHRNIFLQAAQAIGKIGDIIEAGREACLSLFRIVLLPARFNLGIG